MGALGDVAGDFLEVKLHRLGVGEGQRQRGPDAGPRGGNKWRQRDRRSKNSICRLARPRSSPCPLTHEAVFLADVGLILEPDLDRRRRRQAIEMGAQRARGVFFESLDDLLVLSGVARARAHVGKA